MSKSKPISPERAASLRQIADNYELEQKYGVFGLNSTPERIARAKAKVAAIIGPRPDAEDLPGSQPVPPDDGPIQ